jgi:hypothetical protein
MMALGNIGLKTHPKRIVVNRNNNKKPLFLMFKLLYSTLVTAETSIH